MSARKFLDKDYTHNDRRVLRYYAGIPVAWHGNAYRQKEEAELRSELYAFLHEAMRVRKKRDGSREVVPFDPTRRKVDDVLDAIKAETHLPTAMTPPVWLYEREDAPSATDLLTCKSALLHLPTMQIMPCTPDLFTTNALDFDYEPDASEPEQWLEFLHELWGGDDQSIGTLRQWFGYCLTLDTRQQKMLLLVGPKRSGKGTIARVQAELVGKHNVVSPTTSSLAKQFGLQPLIGKSLAIVSDARFGALRDSGSIVERLLCISGEDSLTIPRKYLDDVTLRLPTRFMFLTNELPRLSDASGALAGRFIVLTLTQSFFGREDIRLIDKLLAELPGILNWAIEGWRKLQQQGRFIQPDSATEALRELEDMASPIGAFLRECCVLGSQYEVETTCLYQAWRVWCSRHGRTYPGIETTFGKDLRAALPGLGKRRPRGGDGLRSRFYQGVGLRTDFGPNRSMDQQPGLGPENGGGRNAEAQRRGPWTSVDQPPATDPDELVI